MGTAPKRAFLQRFVILLTIGLLLCAFLPAIHSRTASAVGNCPGEETQGSGADSGKCFLGTTETSNKPTTTGSGGSAGQNSGETGTTCAVEKIGWIVCPIMEGASDLADKTFNMLAGTFLEIDAELFSNNPKGTLVAWEQARNLANVMFIVAFLVIIYSQVTGAGLNNYGIKRMLPRLIIAAIAVNVSYYICQAMVDLSNILGYEIHRALDQVSNQIGPSVLGRSTGQGPDIETSGGLLKLITYAALAVAGVVWFFLAIGSGIIALVFITAITIIIILLMRKAFIVLLVVVSPIAFVMYLLPNTEKLFDKWLSMFWKLLMVFPVVALLMGSGQLASTIILVAGAGVNSGGSSQNSEQCTAQANQRTAEQREQAGYSVIPCEGTIQVGDKQSTWSLGLVAMGVAVAPLLAVWAVLKGALSAAGAIGGKVGGAIAKGTSGGMKATGGAYMKHAAPAIASSTMSGNRYVRGLGMLGSGNVGYHGSRRMASMAAKRDKEETAAVLDKWSRTGKLQKPSELADIARSGLGSIEGQAALQYLAQSEDADTLADIRKGLTREKDIDAYDRAIASKYGTLKAKNPAAVRKLGNKDWDDMSTDAVSRLSDKAVKDGIDQAQARIQNGDASGQQFLDKLTTAANDSRLSSNFKGNNWKSYQHGASAAGTTNAPRAGAGPARLSFNSTGANGTTTPHTGRQVLSQVQAAGGMAQVATPSLVQAASFASQHLSSGGADDGHTQLGTEAVNELRNRGLDYNGQPSGGSNNPPAPRP